MTVPARQRFNLSFTNRQCIRAVDLRLLRRIVQSLLSDHLEVIQADLDIQLVAAPEMTRLNETFVHHAGSTDVITFDYADDVGQASSLSRPRARRSVNTQDACPALHGEIFICADEAFIQARRFRTSWQSEIIRYLIHGLLHLRGYDDQTIAARRQMKRVENRLLRVTTARFPLSKLGRRLKIWA